MRTMVRSVLVLGGAVAMAASAVLPWVAALDRRAVRVSAHGLWEAEQIARLSSPLRSVGLVVVGLAALAVVALLIRQRWLMAIAAVGALAVEALFLRSIRTIFDLRLPGGLRAGAWLLAAGSLLVLVGGLIPRKKARVATENIGNDDRALIARNLERMVRPPASARANSNAARYEDRFS